MGLNIFFVIFMERKIYDYIIQNLTIFQVYLVILMPGIYLIPIKPVHKRDMFFHTMAQQSPGVPQSKLLLLHPLIIMRSLHFMKQAENVCGLGQLFIIFKIHVDFHYLQGCQHQYLKIMRLVLLKLEGDISKEIEPNIFLLNSSILTSFNRVDKLMLNKYSLQIILQICLPNHCLHQLLRSWYME